MACLRENFTTGIVLGGRYKTLSPLNHGSFGMVFMAKDLESGQTVAVKCLTKKEAANDVGIEFAVDDKSEELGLHRRLGIHPNIVSLLDSFETDAHLYLVLEFCERGDLYEAIRVGHGPLETEHVRQFMLELVDAVAYMHSKGVYHRDIKPENIFLTQSGAMKLGDFGLATTERWSYETTVGSDRYMSPEQYDSAGAGYSPAQADIWAIGVCLLNILFSRNPFTKPAEEDPLFLDFSRDKQSLFDVFPSMSQDTYEVIVECMNMDPNKRSLIGARNALRRVVSFTTLDEALDDFCSGDRPVVASSNREPLRTPSLQQQTPDLGHFPWAKALQATPHKPARQLSIIRDDESCTEDLFSDATTADWLSSSALTSSSLYNSTNLGTSTGLGLKLPTPKFGSTLSSSVPILQAFGPMSRPIPHCSGPTSSMAIPHSLPRTQPSTLNFGRKDMAKSWSDLWDEDEEEEEEQTRQALQSINSRTWSNEMHDEEDTPRIGQSPTPASATAVKSDVPAIEAALASANIDEDFVADGFFFQEMPNGSAGSESDSEGVSSPSSPSSLMSERGFKDDKWAALGERRRAGAANKSKNNSAVLTPSRRTGNTVLDLGATGSTHHGPSATHDHTHLFGSKFNNLPHGKQYNSPARKECPWKKGQSRENKDWNFDWRKEKRHALDSVEWVGGCQQSSRSPRGAFGVF